MRPLHDIIAAPADLNSGVFRVRILFDLVPAMADDCRLAFLDYFRNFAARTAAGPLPRDWILTDGVSLGIKVEKALGPVGVP
jgi:hypothetical protein